MSIPESSVSWDPWLFPPGQFGPLLAGRVFIPLAIRGPATITLSSISISCVCDHLDVPICPVDEVCGAEGVVDPVRIAVAVCGVGSSLTWIDGWLA